MMTFVVPRLMRWNGNAVTDHNRSQLSIDVERIEKKQRMYNGIMRKYVISDKRSFGCSWKNLPKSSGQTVDGFWGGEDIESFYNTVVGKFSLELSYADGSIETYDVMFSDFSNNIVKRSTAVDFFDLTISLEEV